ncbi:MAG TPA: hypothetical protein VGD37_40345 [Kofleriaceae bacterium]
MKRSGAILIAASLLLSTSSAALAWTGPQATLANKNGRTVIQICDQGGGCTTSTPFMMAVRNIDWTTSLYEAQLAMNWLSPSANGVVPIVHMVLNSTSDQTVDDAVAHLNTLSPRPYVYLRLRADAPTGAFEPMQMANLQGQSVSDSNNTTTLSPFSYSEASLQYQETQIERVLTRFDAGYPGRVLGVNIGYEVGHEWFFRPNGYDAATGAPSVGGCGTAPDGSHSCGFAPWSNDAGSQAGSIGRHLFYLHDYSPTMQAGFCAWSALPASLRTGCRAATVVERNNAVPGLALPELGRARGAFLDPADLGSLRAAYYNRFNSLQTVNAITRILARAKLVSGNRLLTSAYYGYLSEGLDAALPSSGHTALSSLLASNAIDIIASPYSYAGTDQVPVEQGSRLLGNPFVPQGVPDSPRLNGKLWFHEDDTRTFFASDAADHKTVHTLWDTIRILRRNLLSAGLHNTGSWFLDLGDVPVPGGPPMFGWFGRPTQDSDSQVLWANLTNAFTGVNKLQLGAPNRFLPQVAVFTDDLSPNYLAALTPAGENTFAFSVDVGHVLNDALARIGTPVKQYLLSDLVNANLDLSAIKLAVLPNAWNVPANVRQAIDTRLRTPGRTLLFVYAAGYMNGDAPAATGNIGGFTGINVVAGPGAPVLGESFNVNGTLVPGGPTYPLTPWFRISDASATPLGSYTVAGGTSLARKTIAVAGGSYTSVLAAAPTLPVAMLRKISEDAGVFHFAAAGDIVEAAGNMMILHAATPGNKTINFPQTMPRIFETAIYPADTLMCSGCSSLSQLVFNAGDTRAFRWTTPPFGNFELISGTSTLEGWTADMDVPDQPLAVNVYINGPFGQGGTFFAGFAASTSRPDLTAAFGIPGNHGFVQTLPSCPHGATLYAYGLDPETNGDGSSFIGARTCP